MHLSARLERRSEKFELTGHKVQYVSPVWYMQWFEPLAARQGLVRLPRGDEPNVNSIGWRV